jgi:RHS repeat-associated protein
VFSANYNNSGACSNGARACTGAASGSWLYFGGRLIGVNGLPVMTDRLGSVRSGISYYPWGEERTSPPTQDGQVKFGTYFRDMPGQDYADQRYYTATAGRFYTPDPAGKQAVDSKNPTSWNMYAYAKDDPVNRVDPRGTDDCLAWEFDAGVLGVPCGSDGSDSAGTSSCGMIPIGSPIDALNPGAAMDCLAAAAAVAAQAAAAQQQAASCDISVAYSGTPRDGQDVRVVSGYSPVSNELGPYSPILGTFGWYFAVQIQANLFGDTNPTDWSPWQSVAVFGSGTQSPGGRFQTVIIKPNDSPSSAVTWTQTPGHYDWVDQPGLSAVNQQGQRILSASEIFDFQSSITNNLTGASCSVDWSLRLAVRNGGGQWTVRTP